MASRAFTSVQFALEKNVVYLSAHVTIGANGVPTVDAPNSLGILACTQFTTPAFTATGTSTASITAASSFVNLYNGMNLVGTNVPATATISAINAAAGTFTISNATTGAISSVTAVGGYRLQLGKVAGISTQLDTYNKILAVNITSDLSGLPGAAATQAAAPAWSDWFLMQNTIASGTAGTGASVCFQLGYASSAGTAGWKTVQPASGEGFYVQLMLGNSTAK
jgi:hypothetical protein